MPENQSEVFSLSPRAVLIIATVLRNQKTDPEVDWDQVALECGYKDGIGVRNRYATIKRQLLKQYPSPKEANATSGKPEKSNKRKLSDTEGGLNKKQKKGKKATAADFDSPKDEETKTPPSKSSDRLIKNEESD